MPEPDWVVVGAAIIGLLACIAVIVMLALGWSA